jgi:hypothetical protein
LKIDVLELRGIDFEASWQSSTENLRSNKNKKEESIKKKEEKSIKKRNNWNLSKIKIERGNRIQITSISHIFWF